MKRFVISGLLILATWSASEAQKKEETIVTIGNEKVSVSEFRQVYERNNNNIQDPENKKTPAEYLELFINFKLKVKEAENRGLDTTAAFRNELAGYRRDLAAPYLTDIGFDESEVKTTYDRMTKEVDASHIMLTLPENAQPNDTLDVWQKIMRIREEITGGLDFGEAAVRYSQDPSAAMNKGDLGWFTAFQMVYPFESAAFSTPPGQISIPVRTRFGYHLIKVKGFRVAEGEIKVAHIMKSYPPNSTAEQKNKALRTADSIYALLQNGADFTTLARELSDDAQSAANGGEMPWFSRGRMIPAFSDPAFSLKENGEITRPVDSGFGFHIIKRMERKPLPPFEEVQKEVVEKIKRDPERSIHSRVAFINKLKTDYQYAPDREKMASVTEAAVAWSKREMNDSLFRSVCQGKLFTLNNIAFGAEKWADYIQSQVVTESLWKPGKMADLFETWVNMTVLAYEDAQLESKYPEFRSLMEEYHDGMLLFAISEEMIWQKATADSTGLASFYETNRQKYLWPERFKGMIIRVARPQLKEEVEKLMDDDIPVNEIKDILHLGEGEIFSEEGAWAPNDNPVIDHYIWNGPKPEEWDDESGFVKGNMIPSEPKLLNEARGYHIADYQQFLEEAWLKELRRKYQVKINQKVLKKLENG